MPEIMRPHVSAHQDLLISICQFSAVKPPQFINTLTVKLKQIEAYIISLERDLEMARRDFSATLAATKEFTGGGSVPKSYMNLSKLFPCHVLPKLCKATLEASQTPISTKAIAALCNRRHRP
jgi:hypothetical protein